MTKILVHSKVLDDIQKNWYKTLGEEMPRVCRLLIQDGKMPGERLVHHIKSSSLQNKTFHAGINLPKENVSKRKGARIIYVKENFDLIKIIYAGGHKDKHYDNSFLQVKLIEERYIAESYIQYTESLNFDRIK
ncbi:MAG: hypothetical protein WBC21_03695 [Minisyncoccales bacterium]